MVGILTACPFSDNRAIGRPHPTILASPAWATVVAVGGVRSFIRYRVSIEGVVVPDGIYDFHTHSTLSDGSLAPMELIREASVRDYLAVAVTDHAGFGAVLRLAQELGRDCEAAREHWAIIALPGVELTHLPPGAIDRAAREAREAGAWVVIVHGETLEEPVQPGANRAAIESEFVDVLAHPGLITAEDARIAARNGKFLELSAKPGHGLANGHVARMALAAGARLIVDSDNHAVNFLTRERIRRVVLGAGLDESRLDEIRLINPRMLLDRILTEQGAYRRT